MKPQTIRIRDFILSEIEDHDRDIVRVTADNFKISRQAVHKHMVSLIAENAITKNGGRRDAAYKLKEEILAGDTFLIANNLEEDRVWKELIEPAMPDVRDNVYDIAHFAFTEIFNNAIDHSEGTEIDVSLWADPVKLKILVSDNGIGIFRKLKKTFNLVDEKLGILELAKGRLTTDPSRHTGEGIFWTSRMVDMFSLTSGRLAFASRDSKWLRDLLIEKEEVLEGTLVGMEILRDSPKISQEIFERYAPESDNFGFTHTHLPVSLAKVGRENLVSRSQAKRLLARVDKFKDVMIDFAQVDEIGQAFADEIFRVFQLANPHVKFIPHNMTPAVRFMVDRALSLWREQSET